MAVPVLKLHLNDNVVVCTRSIAAGEKVLLDGHPVTMSVSLGIGHKLACRDIREGDAVIKYGIVIGTATADIDPGSHVHTHNVKSNYIPTYLNEETK
ncbi:MAG TPA: UxaA family hydrolase [Puia sp.]|jgi:hypothetical protein|nr:UxaA family hydrolase [Puia sp.]